MNLPAFCIKRPAFTIVISLILVIIGMIGFVSLPVRWIPSITSPSVGISTVYPGANARLVERDVTKILESGLSGINGIEQISSDSGQGQSNININFKLGTDMNTAVEEVRSALEMVRGMLPEDAKTPIVAKQNNNAMPIMYISFYDPQRNERELGDYIDKFVVPAFETIDGVGNVMVFGKRISAVYVRLDPAKLASTKITVNEVADILHNQNLSIPTGQIRGNDQLYSLVMDTTLKNPEQFKELIIRDNQNQVIRLKDLADIQIDAENSDSAFRVNGKPAIALGITPQSTANPLDVEKNVQRVFADLKRGLPISMYARIDYNIVNYIRASIHSVYESFFEAVLFVWIIILAFLCNFRATIIPVITIPVCMISTFSILYFFGFSINTITLMAFVLAIGLVVDDAIVMLENISRHIENGLTPFAAALRGSREIIFPIIAMTLTLAAVYTPIAFTPGTLGILFREFTFSLAGAVIISGLIALTLTPMMCARLLKQHPKSNRYADFFNRQMLSLQHFYQSTLQFLLQKRVWVVGFLFLFGGLGLSIYKVLPSELAPMEQRDFLFTFAAAPRSASFKYVDSNIRQLESILKDTKDIDAYISIVGMGNNSSNAFQIVNLKPKNKRIKSTEEIMADLMTQTKLIPGVNINVFQPPPPLAEFANNSQGDNIGLVISTSSDYYKLQKVTAQLMAIIKQDPRFVNVDNELKWDSQQFQINIDRDRIADLNLTVPSIANTISTFLAGKTIGKSDDANIILQMSKSALADPNVMNQLYVKNLTNEIIPLSQLISVQETTSPQVYRHFNKLRSDTIYLALAPNFKIADAVKILDSIVKQNLPDDMKFTYTGEAKNFLESNGKTIFTFGLALIFIYLVLVAQFESFIDPLVIMLTVPFAVAGALLTLKIFGGTLNIYSNIGLITLIGLIAKHGILITEFANRLRLEGKSIFEAVVNASVLRLRPILMTTAAMVLGAFPLAFAFGPGAESRQQIGLVIAGGMLLGTVFSLIVIPVTYTFLAPFRKLTLSPIEQEPAHDVLI